LLPNSIPGIDDETVLMRSRQPNTISGNESLWPPGRRTWSEPNDIPDDVLNRILWWGAKGYDAPYPKLR